MEAKAVEETEEECLLSVKVVPRSSRNQAAGFDRGKLKIKLKAPPVEGAAHEAVLEFLGKCLKRPKSSMSIVPGHQSKHKRIKIIGVKAVEAMAVFNQILTGNNDG